MILSLLENKNLKYNQNIYNSIKKMMQVNPNK